MLKKIAKLDDAVAEVDSVINEKAELLEASKKAEKDEYKVHNSERNRVHVLIRKGSKFNPETGAPMQNTVIKKFSYAEWRNVKANFKGLGIKIEKILYNPFKD